MGTRRRQREAKDGFVSKTPKGLQLLALLVAGGALVAGAGTAWWHSTPAPSSTKGSKPVVCRQDDDLHNYQQLVHHLGDRSFLQNVELSYFDGVRGLGVS